MVAIKDVVKNVFIKTCCAFQYKDKVYASVDEALQVWRSEQIEKILPYSSYGYNADKLAAKWEALKAVLNSDGPVVK